MCGSVFKPKIMPPPEPPKIPEMPKQTEQMKQTAPKSATPDKDSSGYAVVARRRVGRGSLRIPLQGSNQSGINFPSS